MRRRWREARRRHRRRRKGRRQNASDQLPQKSLYSALQGQDTIRLLTLKSGSFEEPISCTLVVHEHSLPPFEALSYVWGDPTPRNRIRMNGRRWLIGDNLYDALRNVRRTAEDRIVWIDALCIDQSNLEERSQQVSLMGNIYGESERTLVCLDVRLDNFEVQGSWSWKALLLLAVIARNDAYLKQNPEAPKLPNLSKAAGPLLCRFFSCKWFRRVWVIQEVILSNTATCLLNGHACDWSIIGIAANWFLKLNPKELQVLEITTEAKLGILQAAASWKGTRARRMENLTWPIWTYLNSFGHSQATDPRDLIYGLLGVSKHPETLPVVPAPQPNYADSVRDVFTDWARYMIKASNRLDLLTWGILPGIGSPDEISFVPHQVPTYEVCEETWTPEEASFPTWVPRWNRWTLPLWPDRVHDRPQMKPLYDSSTGQTWFNSSDGQPLKLGPSSSRHTIKPAGVAFDIIKWTGEVMFPSDFAPSSLDDNPIPRNYHIIHAMMHSYPSCGTVEDAFAMSAAAGFLSHDRELFSAGEDMVSYCLLLTAKMSQAYIEVDQEIINKLEEDNVGWGEAHVVHVELTCGYRRFIITEKGYIGLTPGHTKVGDQVCILFGGDCPFILRKVNDHYKLIGDSYIHGIMKGEVTERFRNGELLEQWFEIS